MPLQNQECGGDIRAAGAKLAYAPLHQHICQPQVCVPIYLLMEFRNLALHLLHVCSCGLSASNECQYFHIVLCRQGPQQAPIGTPSHAVSAGLERFSNCDIAAQ